MAVAVAAAAETGFQRNHSILFQQKLAHSILTTLPMRLFPENWDQGSEPGVRIKDHRSGSRSRSQGTDSMGV